MSGDQIKNAADKGKSPVSSERKPLDLARVQAKPQEKLVLDPKRDYLKGGSGKEGTSKQQGGSSWQPRYFNYSQDMAARRRSERSGLFSSCFGQGTSKQKDTSKQQ